ncbi:hypothetical protein C8R45DRAFT_964806 [Mycena sanguinolenta]|nr:hypothetical protein C8R45DRAFT_964806 [Mycena sanguinolenta]
MRGEGFSLGYTLKLLRLSPNLIDYDLAYDTKIFFNGDEDAPKVVLPKLRRLIFGEPGTCPRGGEDLLGCLSLPGLEALRINLFHGMLLPFLKESSPPLLELIIGQFGDMEFLELAECFLLVLDLRRFEMWCPQYRVVHQLMTALAEFPALLPHLGSLSFHLDRYDTTDWMALVRALAARRERLRAFHLAVGKWPPA